MFLSELGLETYINRINSAVLDLQSTAQPGSRLVMYSRKEGLEPPFMYDSTEYTLNWISKPIMMKATESLVKQHFAYLNSNYFSSISIILHQRWIERS